MKAINSHFSPVPADWLRVLVLLLCLSGTPRALSQDRQENLYVDAGQCVFDVKNNQSRCRDGMQVRQGSLRIDAEQGTVFRQGKQIVRIELRGRPVVFRQVLNPQDGELEAKARYMDYRKAKGLLILKGQVVVSNPNLGTFSGEAMEINLNSQEISGSGDERVHMVIAGELAPAAEAQSGKDTGEAAPTTERPGKQADKNNTSSEDKPRHD